MAYATWKQKKSALKSYVAAALKLDRPTSLLLADDTFEAAEGEAVQFENERGASRATRGIWVDLRLGQVVTRSQGEARYEYVDDADPELAQLLPTYGTPSSFTLMVIIGTDDQEDYEAVGEVAGRLRVRAGREDLLADLEAVDIGLTEVMQTINADFAGDDGRVYSQSMTELRFETVEVDEPEAGDTGPFINEVEGIADPELTTGDFYSGPVES